MTAVTWIGCLLPLCPLTSWPEPAGCGGWSALHGNSPWRRMPSPDSHEHGIPLFGHLKGKTEKRERIFTLKQAGLHPNPVFISHHPAATVEQRRDEPHLCRWHTTAPLKRKVADISSPQYSGFPDSWLCWSQCSRGWEGKALLFLPDREAPQTGPK